MGDGREVVVGSSSAPNVLKDVLKRKCMLGDNIEMLVGSSSASKFLFISPHIASWGGSP